MTDADAITYTEAPAVVRAVPLSHVSIEVGHISVEEMDDDDRVRAHFASVRPWLDSATTTAPGSRISTCLLLDDHDRRTVPAREAVTRVLRVARECGVRIDYLVRESGCVVTDGGVQLAELVYSRLLPEPPPGSTGARPPLQESGWLSNGERSVDVESDQAMPGGGWRPPHEFGKRDHTVFLDVELVKLDPSTGERLWSGAFLTAVWHLLRLGLVRNFGEPVVTPVLWPSDQDWPDVWDDLPRVVQVTPGAEAFAAYRSVSIVPNAFLPTEHAARLVLGHLALDPVEIDQVVERGAREHMTVPRSAVKRTSLVLYDQG